MKGGRAGIIALVPDRWGGVWMPRHQIMSRLANEFDVVWIEPARGWREYWAPRGAGDSEIHNATYSAVCDYDEVVQSFVQVPETFTVLDTGRWLPEIYRPRAVADWVRRQRVVRAARLLRQRGCSRIILYIWRPDYAWALAAIDAELSCYHIDDDYSFSKTAQPISPQELGLIRDVDRVIVHSRNLMAKKGAINPNTIMVPNGVDFRSYSTDTHEPADLESIPHPRLGYIGVVKTQLDLDLLLELAHRRADWSLVIVGPRGYLGDKESVLDELARTKNVHLMGNRQLSELPAYTQHMDVCLMCYEISDYTNSIYPLKLHEYLASGRPVVAAPVDMVKPFADVVSIAHTTDEWEQAICKCLEPSANEPHAVAARREKAKEHDWDLLAGRVADYLREGLAQKA